MKDHDQAIELVELGTITEDTLGVGIYNQEKEGLTLAPFGLSAD